MKKKIELSEWARLYGKRRSKRKTEKLIEDLTKND